MNLVGRETGGGGGLCEVEAWSCLTGTDFEPKWKKRETEERNKTEGAERVGYLIVGGLARELECRTLPEENLTATVMIQDFMELSQDKGGGVCFHSCSISMRHRQAEQMT